MGKYDASAHAFQHAHGNGTYKVYILYIRTIIKGNAAYFETHSFIIFKSCKIGCFER